jgi:leader peptidase (prepilin peptidase)/N-methyltransferase
VWGALWGSFANVVIVRLPRGGSLLRPASHCVSCGTTIRFYDNIPIFSFLLRRGRCRFCGARYSARYFVVELVLASLSALLWWRAALATSFATTLVRFTIEFLFMGVLVVLSFIDFEHMILPDVITLPSIAIFFALGFLEPGAPVWWQRLAGAAGGFGLVWGGAELFYRLTGREGIGLGDGKLLALMGALLGWQGVVFACFAGSVQGLAFAIPRQLVRRQRLLGVEIPFGPFLALGGLEYLLAREYISKMMYVLMSGDLSG